MRAKHTPGPWSYEDPLGPEILSIVVGDEPANWKFVAQTCDEDFPFDVTKANACLIAAAPDLLAVAQKLDWWWAEDFPGGPDGDTNYATGIGRLSDDTLTIWRELRAAIAKAEGRS